MKDYMGLLGQQVTVRVLYPLGSVEPWDNDNYDRVFPINWGYADAFWEDDKDLLTAYILEEKRTFESDSLYSGKVTALLKDEANIQAMIVTPDQSTISEAEIRECLSFDRDLDMTNMAVILN